MKEKLLALWAKVRSGAAKLWAKVKEWGSKLWISLLALLAGLGVGFLNKDKTPAPAPEKPAIQELVKMPVAKRYTAPRRPTVVRRAKPRINDDLPRVR